MEAVASRLSSHRLVGLDTPVFIYLLENHLRFRSLARTTISQVAAGSVTGVTSAVTLMEVAVRPLQTGDYTTAYGYESMIRNTPNLTIVHIGSEAARSAATIRAKYGSRPADALQIGACLSAGATAFVTNDKRLRTIRELEIIVLDDFIH